MLHLVFPVIVHFVFNFYFSVRRIQLNAIKDTSVPPELIQAPKNKQHYTGQQKTRTHQSHLIETDQRGQLLFSLVADSPLDTQVTQAARCRMAMTIMIDLPALKTFFPL